MLVWRTLRDQWRHGEQRLVLAAAKRSGRVCRTGEMGTCCQMLEMEEDIRIKKASPLHELGRWKSGIRKRRSDRHNNQKRPQAQRP
ncbi:hypothetical protein B296_00044144 [Ensete ventricosum]|uniref:Uncharacterized protein n=1 Tax=Ensete ventricosum TaxID=4639 RepID=A0A426YMG8_ENSVE|nr:hypothetical protein B296_00044144 [Ensete ventricosum]